MRLNAMITAESIHSLLPYVPAGAVFSDDMVYRYRLWRTWDPDLPTCLFIMLNPSTADHEQNDPTIRRCLDFAKQWGYGQLLVGNLFALRATDPARTYGTTPNQRAGLITTMRSWRCTKRPTLPWRPGACMALTYAERNP